MANKLGGGIGSKQHVEKGQRIGVGARAVNKNWPATVGLSRGNRVGGNEGGSGKVLKGVRADPYKPPNFDPVRLGNSLVNNVGAGGPGKGRVLYGRGSQGQHGSAVPGVSRPTKGQWP